MSDLPKVIRLVELRFKFRQPGSRACFLSHLSGRAESSLGAASKGKDGRAE